MLISQLLTPFSGSRRPHLLLPCCARLGPRVVTPVRRPTMHTFHLDRVRPIEGVSDACTASARGEHSIVGDPCGIPVLGGTFNQHGTIRREELLVKLSRGECAVIYLWNPVDRDTIHCGRTGDVLESRYSVWGRIRGLL